jgi:adenylate cyclase
MDQTESRMTEEEQEEFRQALLCGEGLTSFRRFRGLVRKLPSDPRCAMCFNPFGGIGGRIMRLAGFQPSRKNPRFCNT